MVDSTAKKTTDESLTPSSTWSEELQWYRDYFHLVHFFFLVFSLFPLSIVVQHVPLTFNTFIMSSILLIVPALSITAGYHRLWAHKSYHACTSLRVLLAIIGASMWQWSIKWWVHTSKAPTQPPDEPSTPS